MSTNSQLEYNFEACIADLGLNSELEILAPFAINCGHLATKLQTGKLIELSQACTKGKIDLVLLDFVRAAQESSQFLAALLRQQLNASFIIVCEYSDSQKFFACANQLSGNFWLYQCPTCDVQYATERGRCEPKASKRFMAASIGELGIFCGWKRVIQ